MAIMAASISLPSTLTLSYNRLSSSSSSMADNLSLSLSSLSLHHQTTKRFIVRMGGGPRTFPGGVSKWQWKRMQKKKASQLLKARLMRERQIYEMRKRAELKAAVSELERPWEVVQQAAPNLFSVSADEQLKVLADRFQKPGGFDLWTEKDGPQLFDTPDGLPTSRFFPKGVVHGIKPYGRVNSDDDLGEMEDEIDGMETHFRGRLTGGSNSDQQMCAYSSSPRVSSGVNRRQIGQRNFDREGSGNQRDRNLSVKSSVTENSHSHVKSSYSSDSRVSSGGSQHQSGQRNLDREGSDSQRDQRNLDKKGIRRRNNVGYRKNVGSGRANGVIKVPELRRSSSSSSGREQRNSSRDKLDGNNCARSDLRVERGRSSYADDVYELSLQTDGKYSLGSS